MQDLTGQPPSDEDVAQAMAVLKKSLVLYIIKIPPELAVEIPNVLRCLKHYQELRGNRDGNPVWCAPEQPDNR